jgi:hypothetical protein
MIGEVPKGAPLRCRLGRHTGSEPPAGGGTFHQKKDYSAQLRAADAAIDRGDLDLADRIHREAANPGSEDPVPETLPAAISIDRFREIVKSGNEGHEAIADQLAASKEGTEIILPSISEDYEEEGAAAYVWDGSRLLHRADTQAAKMLMKNAERRLKRG